MTNVYPDIKTLEQLASHTRRTILMMLEKAKSGHPGGSLSLVEILIGLYHYKMRHDPKNPHWADRDICVLSKGHGCPALYAVLASCGYFPEQELLTLRQFRSRLQGHAFFKVPGVDASTGSLGQGLSLAVGFSLAARMEKKEKKIFCILGDGELQEGQVWEAAMLAAYYRLSNIRAIIDRNILQIDGFVRETINIEPLVNKWKAFGWHVLEVDGHNVLDLMKGYDRADASQNKPVVIIAHTIKGKGVSFMEHQAGWHGVAPNKKDLDKALEELGGINS